MNWFTIFAQLFNFIVLIFLLNKFLYKPLLKTMNARKEEIRDRIDDSEKKLEEAERLNSEYKKKLLKVENENQILREKAIIELKEFKEAELISIKNDLSAKKISLMNI